MNRESKLCSLKTLFNFQVGTIVEYRGNSCLILEHRKDGTLLMVLKHIEYAFGSTNNFARSNLRKYLNSTYMDMLTQGNHEDILERNIDLTALDGSKQYGTDSCYIAPLTFGEYQKYHNIIPTMEKWHWSVTPLSTPCIDGDETWMLGLLNENIQCFDCNRYNNLRCYPVFLLSSDYVVESENTLASYTTKELLEELLSRIDEEEDLERYIEGCRNE